MVDERNEEEIDEELPKDDAQGFYDLLAAANQQLHERFWNPNIEYVKFWLAKNVIQRIHC